MINLNDFLAVGQNAIARRVVQHSDASDNFPMRLRTCWLRQD